ncbi:MAG: VWA domain-containing protein, partial [Planctomycetaceae bacterium]|nr:VWA domain-containing protein [Planctomycetaceae bacterium]
ILALLILSLQSDPRERLFEAVRETRVEETQKILADLALGDGARAARIVVAALPKARERLNALVLASLRARENYENVDTSFGFNIKEETMKTRSLEVAAGRIRETVVHVIEGEKVYQSLLDILGFLKPEAIPVLEAEVEHSGQWLLRCEVLDGLGALGAKTALSAVIDRETTPVVLAAALAAAPTEKGTAFLTNNQWQVRLAALDALRGSRSSVGPIVESMAQPDLRYRKEAATALGRLTETFLAPDPDVWSDWWKANREDFERGNYSPFARKLPEGPGRTVAFYDIPVHSSRVCFVIDRSRSMREQGRFDGAKRELKRILEKLPEGAVFNVIFFGGSSSSLWKYPRLLDEKTRRDATEYVDRMGLESGTDLYGALEKALTMVGSPDSGRVHEDGADTIVVLSDGQATVGKVIDDELIARIITRRARYLRPVFHTVSLSSDSRSLKLLAEKTGGEYRAK